MSDDDDRVKLALRLQEIENEIEKVNARLDRADGRWLGVFELSKKAGLVISAFLLTFWLKAKGLL